MIKINGLSGLGMSAKAKNFVSRKIRTLIVKEHYSPKRAVAAAFSMAREKGYKVPRPR